VRRSFGPLHLGTLAAGEVRDLSKVERGALLTLSRAARDSASTPSATTDSRETDSRADPTNGAPS
jgi:23S rRNA pseudouridine2605 synthase/16S rRNA pseudouridine516 synthase